MRKRRYKSGPPRATSRRGSLAVEYILLVTMLGIGVVAGLAALRDALVTELNEIATLISAIH